MTFEEQTIIRECPFCGNKNETKIYLNTICTKCNAKYYTNTFEWWDRKPEGRKVKLWETK